MTDSSLKAGSQHFIGKALRRFIPRKAPPVIAPAPFAHRGTMAATWDELGQLQRDYLIAAGLLPEHRLLDIGCGALQAGVKFIPYLKPNHYFGIDASKTQLDAGYDIELGALDLQTQCPRNNLSHSALFQHRRLEQNSIDFGLCVSVLPYLPSNYVRICLEQIRKYFRPGGQLHISYLEVPEGHPYTRRYTNMSRVVSYSHKQPYHHFRQDMMYAARESGWTPRFFGNWAHPHGEIMMICEKL